MSKVEKKYVVYNERIGRAQPGVYVREVKIVGKTAFVLPKAEGQRTAHMVLADHVFNTQEEAAAYLAGKGVRRWVVGTFRTGPHRRSPEVPMMFEAFVTFYTYNDHFRAENKIVIQKVLNGATLLNDHTYNIHTYETKEEAEKDFIPLWHKKMEETKRYIADYVEHASAMVAHGPPGVTAVVTGEAPSLAISTLETISKLKNDNALRSWRGAEAVRLAERALRTIGKNNAKGTTTND